MLAAASGWGSIPAKASSGERPSPAWICARTASSGIGATESCRRRSSATNSPGSRSARVERTWPSFTHVGPRSSSIRRKRRAVDAARVSGAGSTGSRRPTSRNTPARSSRSANPCRAAMVAICRSLLRSWRFKGSAQGATTGTPRASWGRPSRGEAAAVDRSTATARTVSADEQPADVPVTPMIRQYLDAKARAGDAFLFFRLGDFYELFFEDAVRAAEILGITLTARSKGADRVPMCGVPFHAARRYLARLLEAGHKVAICEQVEAPGSGPGIVRREIVRIVTPGTVLDEDVLDATRAAWLVAVSAGDGANGAALLDVSTGDFRAFQGPSLSALLEAVAAHEPREVLLPSDASAAVRTAVRDVLGT